MEGAAELAAESGARERRGTLLALSTLTVMAGATIAPTLPALRDQFASEPRAELLAKLVLTLPALAIALAAPWAGALVDRLGRKRVLVAGCALYALAGASGLVLDTLPQLLVGRALLGVAVGALMTATTALAGDYYQGAERSAFLGQQGATMSFGGFAFLTAGGLLADVHWRAPFAVYLVSLTLLPAALLWLHEPACTASAPAAGFAEEQDAARFPWGIGVLLCALGLVGMSAFYLLPVQLPFHLRALLGASSTQSGMVIATSTLFGGLAAMSYGRLRRGGLTPPAIFALLFGLLGVGYGLLASARSYPQVLFAMVATGAGMGLMMPNLNAWLLTTTPPPLRGRAVGALTASLFLGQFLSPIAAAPVNARLGLGGTFGAAAAGLVALGLVFAAVAAWARARSR